MITISSLPHPDQVPRVRAGRTLAVSVDLEWTKNYRIKNGNQPFCLSVVHLDLPTGTADLTNTRFEYTSIYLEPGEPTAALVRRSGALLRSALDRADILTGHQVCADLAILANTAATPVPAVTRAREAWRHRRKPEQPGPRFIDTRYDSGHLLEGASRRLVDVATALGLDVTQPELRSTSMTALHRAWLDRGDDAARERVSVLNLRHSLSTALLALRVAERGQWYGVLNVNRLIADQAGGSWHWLDSPTFRSLLKEAPDART